MRWEVQEVIEDKDGVKTWTLHVQPKGTGISGAKAFAHGYWFYGREGGDTAGKRFYEEGKAHAKAEAERLTRLGVPPAAR